MKQEQLKVALCGYLPYGVKFEVIEKGTFSNSPDSVIYVCADFNNAEHLMREKPYRRKSSKMVLFNISTLTKPIIVKGYNGGLPFVPKEEIAKEWKQINGEHIDMSIHLIHFIRIEINSEKGLEVQEMGLLNLPYWIIDLLNRWKIDYRNLIGQGLAIDVETLKENCYE